MGFTEAVSSCFSKYITFSGRAARSEMWWFVLFSVIGSVVLGIVDSVVFGMMSGGMMSGNMGLLGGLFSLVMICPSISVAVRRLHDTNRSGWWYWIVFVPLVGVIVLIFFFVSKGTDGPNDFGDDPLGGNGGGQDNAMPDASLSRSTIPSVKR